MHYHHRNYWSNWGDPQLANTLTIFHVVFVKTPGGQTQESRSTASENLLYCKRKNNISFNIRNKYFLLNVSKWRFLSKLFNVNHLWERCKNKVNWFQQKLTWCWILMPLLFWRNWNAINLELVLSLLNSKSKSNNKKYNLHMHMIRLII